MDFLVKVSPSVDWKRGKVTTYVGNKKYILPSCDITSINQVSDDNSFAGLEIENINSDLDNSGIELSRDTICTKNSVHVAPV